MTVAFVAALLVGLCVLVEAVAQHTSLSPESARKLVHIPSGIVGALLPLVLSFAEIAGLAAGFAALMVLSLRFGIFTRIHDVTRSTYGEVYFPLGIAALAVVCPQPAPFAYGVLVLGVGDGSAAVIGGRLGKRIVPLVQTTKTLWGCGAFLASCSVLGFALLASAGGSLPYTLVAAAAIALALTPVELFLTQGLDNLALPVLAGMLFAGL